MRFIGIDFSLTSTGVAIYDTDTGQWDTLTIKTPAHDKSEPGFFLDRIASISARIINYADPHEDDVLAIEDLVLHVKGSAVSDMYGGWWLNALHLISHHGQLERINTTTIKKLATGKGNAGKDEILLATERRIPEAHVTGNDQADAVWVTVAASIIHGHPIIKLPANHTTGAFK